MKTLKYEFADGYRISRLDPEVVGEALQDIETRNGNLKPQAVVDTAKSKRHVLHDYFEWDDSVAGEKWRLEQAQYLIRSVRVVVSNGEDSPPTRAFIHLTTDDGPLYMKAATVMSDDNLRSLAIKEARKLLISAKRRVEEFEDLASVYKSIERIERKLERAA